MAYLVVLLPHLGLGVVAWAALGAHVFLWADRGVHMCAGCLAKLLLVA